MSACPRREDAAVTATRRVSDATVLRQQLRADVGRREVVGGVIRLLPDEEWLRRVRDDLGPLGDLLDRCGRSFELAEDDLVVPQQNRAEVADVRRETGGDSRVERPNVLVSDVGPEALGGEAFRFRIHYDRS